MEKKPLVRSLKFFLLRCGESGAEVKSFDPPLSEFGKIQAENLAKIVSGSRIGLTTDIYCSNSKKSIQTANIIHKRLLTFGTNIRKFEPTEKLFTDPATNADEVWLENEVESSNANNLIVIGHIDLVHYFPLKIGFPENRAKAGEGIIIENECW